MPEKSSAGDRMRELVAAVAGPREWGDTRESWLGKAARRSGLSYRAIKALWYGEISDDKHPFALVLRSAAEKRERSFNKYAAVLNNAADRLLVADPEMGGPQADFLRDLAHRLRCLPD